MIRCSGYFAKFTRTLPLALVFACAAAAQTAPKPAAAPRPAVQKPAAAKPAMKLNDLEYFETPGVNVMVFQDIYPEGHQGGVNLIQNGLRVASNGDIRLEPTPGQWSPLPKQDKRVVDKAAGEIVATMSYPDESRNRKGFNPIDYPDLKLSYKVRVRGEGEGVKVTVDFDQPIPAEWVGKIGFNLELYPASLFGKTWYLGDRSGIFYRQANGPEEKVGGVQQPVPLAVGKRLSVAPEVESQRLIIESRKSDIQLFDGRNQHNNGWFIARSLVPAGATTAAIEWVITPHGLPAYKSEPVVHVSQVGYHPDQPKTAVIELDPADAVVGTVQVKRVAENGGFETVQSGKPAAWGKFLRYNYLKYDFSAVKKPGMYVIEYGKFRTEPFQISAEVFKRHVWQPTLEYFLPAQMCHMRVEEQYKVWHGACHLDDARMAPINLNHFDGYAQGASTLNKYKSGETVPGLNVGGWHDAGDDDLRIESQSDEVIILASAFESFGIDYDDTTVDQAKHLVRIHQPDGKPDLLQQVEHGVLSILGGYRAMGRFYRGIITPTIPQYTILGDTANVTDNLMYDASLKPGERTGTTSSLTDDRWVFTEQNPSREFKGIAALAIAGRVMKDYNPALAKECVDAAETLWAQDRAAGRSIADRATAAIELWLTTKKPVYGKVLTDNRAQIIAGIGNLGPAVGKVLNMFEDKTFVEDIRKAVAANFARTVEAGKATPFGIPYRPQIWGAGWDIQKIGYQQYFLHRAFPDIVTADYMLNALNFVLGVHPGSNTASFASGVGSRSMTIAYGFNRADYSYIPGGVGSGTALIRPDFPELKDFPYLWQQGEYVLGGGASNFMFLVMAADQLYSK
jgi:endoglucanase